MIMNRDVLPSGAEEGHECIEKMGVVEKAAGILLNPSDFFRRIKSETGTKGAIKYLIIISAIGLVVNLSYLSMAFDSESQSLKSLGISSMMPSMGNMISLFESVYDAFLIAGPFVGFLINILFSFGAAKSIQFFARRSYCKGDYSDTYKSVAYSSTPAILFGWLPYAGFVFTLYSFYLSLKGMSILHEISMGKAFYVTFVLPGMAVLVPLIILLIVIIYLVATSLSSSNMLWNLL